ncbi:MAG: ribonuclease D, partial [Moorea sp. SIO4G2]|nr:ribonuclease D [Moorena sp. SIO4G2]
MTNTTVIEELKDFQVCDRDLPESICQEYLRADSLAVDTETMG